MTMFHTTVILLICKIQINARKMFIKWGTPTSESKFTNLYVQIRQVHNPNLSEKMVVVGANHEERKKMTSFLGCMKRHDGAVALQQLDISKSSWGLAVSTWWLGKVVANVGLGVGFRWEEGKCGIEGAKSDL